MAKSGYSFGRGMPTYNGMPMVSGVPVIAGQYFHVNPRIGADGNPGTSPALGKVLDTFTKAEDLCKTDVGDGIMVWSQGNTSVNTTTYLTSTLAFDKSGLTVFGVSSGSPFYGRARISAGTSDDLAYLVDVSGSNNAFYNIHMANYGDAAAALGCLRVTGNRNFFYGCHFQGAGHATPGAIALSAGSNYGAHDLMLSGSENTFVNCVFGTNSVVRNAANAPIIIGGQQSKNHFVNCRTFTHNTDTSSGGVGLYAINVLNGWLTFDNCIFTNWEPIDMTANTSWLIGSNPTNVGILLHNCGSVGFSAWDSVNADRVYVTNAQGHVTGGIGIGG